MAHPRIEEVEDSDDGFSDPSEGDIDDFDEGDILRTVQPRQTTTSTVATRTTPAAQPHAPPPHLPLPTRTNDALPPAYNGFAALYPVYFDRSRSRAEGRRVRRALAVDNPLARDMVTACAQLGLRTVFEPTKTHPKDWANPGRVKVDLPRGGGESKSGSRTAAGRTVHNKHHLYLLVAQHLAAHPTTEASAGLREMVQDAPPPPPASAPYPRPAVPRGWKMPTLVPYLSPAMTGGGVTENLLQDVMKEMQTGAGAGGGAAGGPSAASMQQALQAMAVSNGPSEPTGRKGRKAKK